MGSLLAACASYLRARQAQGEWLLRIENIDPPREMPGASDSFLHTLEAVGFEWHGSVVYQRDRIERYRSVVDALNQQQTAYRCRCSRRDIQQAIAAQNGPESVYPGTCLGQPPNPDESCNHRLNAGTDTLFFSDALQGEQCITFGRDQGDFVIWRKDDLPSYQLAVTVDDLDQGITEVVRGIDLLHETAGQIVLRRHLSETQPDWMHIPVIVNSSGEKLSKQTAAPSLQTRRAAQHLCDALALLGLGIPSALRRAAVRDIWSYAIEHWEPNQLSGKEKVTLE